MFLSKGKNNELLPFQKGTTQAAVWNGVLRKKINRTFR